MNDFVNDVNTLTHLQLQPITSVDVLNNLSLLEPLNL